MTARICTDQELRDLESNFWRVVRHYEAMLTCPSLIMAWESAQADRKNAARAYAAIARSL